MALGPLEREIMSCLWAAQGPLTVREVHAELSEHRQVAYTTVMTVLQPDSCHFSGIWWVRGDRCWSEG
ncbi:hypothetical protein HJG43_13970 [Kineosporiaceae bacterium SCSIO 59966]|nr:hypothetical protein HJG43_13970 [Kineosporiaceae bacterium SCSIO 59966]